MATLGIACIHNGVVMKKCTVCTCDGCYNDRGFDKNRPPVLCGTCVPSKYHEPWTKILATAARNNWNVGMWYRIRYYIPTPPKFTDGMMDNMPIKEVKKDMADALESYVQKYAPPPPNPSDAREKINSEMYWGRLACTDPFDKYGPFTGLKLCRWYRGIIVSDDVKNKKRPRGDDEDNDTHVSESEVESDQEFGSTTPIAKRQKKLLPAMENIANLMRDWEKIRHMTEIKPAVWQSMMEIGNLMVRATATTSVDECVRYALKAAEAVRNAPLDVAELCSPRTTVAEIIPTPKVTTQDKMLLTHVDLDELLDKVRHGEAA